MAAGRDPERPGRWAWAEVDHAAIFHNVTRLRETVAPADLWAVAKANGYGHGAVGVARAALAAGADGLCVALVQEGEELRGAGIDAPILLLSQQPPEQLDRLVELDLVPTAYTPGHVADLHDAVGRVGRRTTPHPVHVKVDTGMQRVGAPPAAAAAVAARIGRSARLRFDGVFTHLACADEPDHPANGTQLDTFDGVVADLESAGLVPRSVHAANSAAALGLARSRRSFVRAGIAIYGISPGPALDAMAAELRPALRLVARVSQVKRVAPGSHVSYGWRHRFERATTVATLPIGYADGVPRRLGTSVGDPDAPARPGADVLVGGQRCPIVGVVTMDQVVVDVGRAVDDGHDVAVGDEAVLIGAQGNDRIRAEDWAARLGTIGYEIVCNISARIERRPV